MARCSSAAAIAVSLALATGFGSGLGCGGGGGEGEDAPEREQQPVPADPDDAPAPAQDPFGQLGAFGAMLSARANEPGPYDDPRQSPGFDEDEAHFVVLELDGAVVELESFDFFAGDTGTELRALTDRLDAFARDETIAGMVLRIGAPSMELAVAEELRDALIAFKTAGGRNRALVCHTEGAADATYFLMTACDAIGLAPTGAVMLTGAAAMPIHLKGLLDKAGIAADFIHIGAFKGAAEPLTRDAPSREMRETLDALLDRAYATTVSAVAAARELPEPRVRQLIDRAVFVDDDAVEAGLVDTVAAFGEFRDARVGEGIGWRSVEVTPREQPGIGKLMELLGMVPRSRPRGPHVAVVYAVGNVVDGAGGGLLGARNEIASRPLSAALRALGRDDSVKAVVLRVSSPGGSALSSELILRAVEEVKAAGKPVVVSMGGVAASGGYYISSKADKIFAQPNTLTGSIGVVGGKLVIRGALDKLGVTAHPMGRGKRALLWSSVDRWSADEKQAVREMMDATYRTFVQHVADGRGKSYEDIHRIAQGRVWTGADALERGLVDQLGGLSAAIAEARTLGNVPDDAELEIYPPEPTLLDILGSFGQVSLPHGLDTVTTTIHTTLGPRAATAVTTYLRQLLQFRTTPIQTALILLR